jgi:hypothetical protein
MPCRGAGGVDRSGLDAEFIAPDTCLSFARANENSRRRSAVFPARRGPVSTTAGRLAPP